MNPALITVKRGSIDPAILLELKAGNMINHGPVHRRDKRRNDDGI